MNCNALQMLNRLHDLGVSDTDALALRRISMTLHRWHELECGDGNNYGSWCITRGRKVRHAQEPNKYEFIHDEDGKPYMEHHHYTHGNGEDYTTYTPLADKETGAKKSLAKILADYPHLTPYIQTDPRGCALYILRKDAIPPDTTADMIYNSRGVAVHK